MIVAVSDLAKDEKTTVGKFFVSVLIRTSVLKYARYLYIKPTNH